MTEYIYLGPLHVTVNETQQILMSMYRDIKRILDENGITFYIQYGTAIGALRHDGFIPWDDDIDILVWEEDIPRINKVLSEGLDSGKYYYHIPSADTHPHVIYKGDDVLKGLQEKTLPFIDLFPIDRYPSTGLRRLIANVMIWGNVGTIWAIDHVSNRTLHRMLAWIPDVFKKLASWTVNKDSDLTVVYSTGFKHCIFPAGYYGVPVMHVFEDSEAPLPCEYDRMLTHIYGDYMTPPPEDKRTGAGGFPCSVYKDYISDHGSGSSKP